MSLRTDFHAAFDELAPSTIGLPERVVQTVVDERITRRRARRLWVTFRGPASLVAVFLVIVIVVGVIVGGRFVRDWNAFTKHSVPAGGIDSTVLAQLEARPLLLPHLNASADCPAGPWNDTTGWPGSWPLYVLYQGGSADPADTSSAGTPWGVYYSREAATDASLSGPVLVRARILDTNQPVIFVGDHGSGAVIGIDNLQGTEVQQYAELVLDASNPPATRSGQFITWRFTEGTPKGNSPRSSVTGPVLCVGWQVDWQVDGVNFTERFVTSG